MLLFHLNCFFITLCLAQSFGAVIPKEVEKDVSPEIQKINVKNELMKFCPNNTNLAHLEGCGTKISTLPCAVLYDYTMQLCSLKVSLDSIPALQATTIVCPISNLTKMSPENSETAISLFAMNETCWGMCANSTKECNYIPLMSSLIQKNTKEIVKLEPPQPKHEEKPTLSQTNPKPPRPPPPSEVKVDKEIKEQPKPADQQAKPKVISSSPTTKQENSPSGDVKSSLPQPDLSNPKDANEAKAEPTEEPLSINNPDPNENLEKPDDFGERPELGGPNDSLDYAKNGDDDPDDGAVIGDVAPSIEKSIKPNAKPETTREDEVRQFSTGNFVEAEDSHFFAYFLTFVCFTVMGYIAFHNKNKILALVLEGRRGKPTRRRPNSASYRKLDSLEEAMMTHPSHATTTHVIY